MQYLQSCGNHRHIDVIMNGLVEVGGADSKDRDTQKGFCNLYSAGIITKILKTLNKCFWSN